MRAAAGVGLGEGAAHVALERHARSLIWPGWPVIAWTVERQHDSAASSLDVVHQAQVTAGELFLHDADDRRGCLAGAGVDDDRVADAGVERPGCALVHQRVVAHRAL